MKYDLSKSIDFVLVAPYQDVGAFGVRLIESYLKERGYEVVTIYFKKRDQSDSFPTDKEVDLLVDLIVELDPLLVGFSVMSVFNNISRHLTQKVREKVNTPIVWGGVHPTICPEDCTDIADIICVGEGEGPIMELIDSVRASGTVSDNVSNCWIRKGEDFIKNPIQYFCSNLDELPYPDFSGDHRYFIDNGQLKNEDPYATYIATRNKYLFKAFRGCPFSCTYCGSKTIRQVYETAGQYYRNRSIDNVIGELKEVMKQFPNINTIHSNDEVFISDKEYVAEFAKRYKEEIGVPFTCAAHLNMVTDEKVAMLVDAGLTTMNVGIEAFSEYVRREVYNRKMSNKIIVEKANILRKHNVFVTYDFIYDNPLETEKDLENCFWDLIVKLPRPCEFDSYSLSYLPKTELAERFLKEGRISQSDIVGTSDKGLTQWKMTSTYQRSKGIMRWFLVNALYSLRIKRGENNYYVPAWLVKLVARSKSYILVKVCLKAAVIMRSLMRGRAVTSA